MPDINETIQKHAGLVYSQLNKLKLRSDPEAESIGYEALYEAAKSFDEEKGFEFSTYATCCIFNALGSYIRFLNRKKQLEVVSYNNEVDGLEYLHVLASTENIEQEYVRREVGAYAIVCFKVVRDALSSPKQQEIVDLWQQSEYLISNTELAKATDVSQPYVNQVLSAFKYKLKKKLEAMYYD